MNTHKSKIIEILDSSKSKIQIAVSWFTDEAILQRLIELAKFRKIEILTSADEMNILRHLYFRELIKQGAIIRKIGSSSPLEGDFMHSKFIIIDDESAWGGSYNFTSKASSNYEAFRKWDISELNGTKKDFENWMNAAVDFFFGIENIDEILERIKGKFTENNRKSGIINRFKHTTFNEDTYIQKREEELKTSAISYQSINFNKNYKIEKTETIRQTAAAVTSNNYGISSEGTIVHDTLVVVKPHTFHGGYALQNPRMTRSNDYSLACFQKHHIDKTFNCFKTNIVNGALICKGELQPTPEVDKYNVRIEFRPGLIPQVFIKSPEIKGSSEIHIYNEGFLCLFDRA